MKPIRAWQVAESLNHIGIICAPVREGNPDTLEHGEVAVKHGKHPMTLFVSPVNDTLYLAVWKPSRRSKGVEADDGTYKYTPAYHYAGQFHRIIRAIRHPSHV